VPPKPKPKAKEDTVLATAGRTAATDAASPDTLLLVGGLALFVLVLGDAVFLALSSRFLREARY
jgi:hypothetical protein